MIGDFINSLIKGRSSIAHATEVSKSREKKSKNDRKEKERIFARSKSTTNAQAKSFKIAVSHERSPKQADPLVIYNLPTVKTPTRKKSRDSRRTPSADSMNRDIEIVNLRRSPKNSPGDKKKPNRYSPN